jgi:flotillin
MNPVIVLVLVIILAVVAVLLILNLYGRMYRKVGPNQALIVYGAGGQRILTGGGTLVIPLVQESKLFSLELMSFDVAPQQNLYTNQGVSVKVEAVTQLKVRSDRDSILTAAEQFLSKTPQEREAMIRLVMEGHLRGIVGLLTVEQIVKEPEMVSEKMRSTSSADLAKMGLEVVSRRSSASRKRRTSPPRSPLATRRFSRRTLLANRRWRSRARIRRAWRRRRPRRRNSPSSSATWRSSAPNMTPR